MRISDLFLHVCCKKGFFFSSFKFLQVCIILFTQNSRGGDFFLSTGFFEIRICHK